MEIKELPQGLETSFEVIEQSGELGQKTWILQDTKTGEHYRVTPAIVTGWDVVSRRQSIGRASFSHLMAWQWLRSTCLQVKFTRRVRRRLAFHGTRPKCPQIAASLPMVYFDAAGLAVINSWTWKA